MARMPDFLIIGAAKAGTTSLYFYLQQHPRIFMALNKEPFFFTFEGQDVGRYLQAERIQAKRHVVTDLEVYQSLFAAAPAGSLAGEASTLYLYDAATPARIKSYLPDVKLIAILRNPVDRAYSHFQHFVRDGFEPERDFMAAIRAERAGERDGWYPSYRYLDAGFYSVQLQRYYDLFARDQIKVCLYEDLNDAPGMMKGLFKFLGLDARVAIDTEARHNPSGSVRYPWLYRWGRESARLKPALRRLLPVRLWSRLRSAWEQVVVRPGEPLDPEYRRELQQLYRSDILKVQGMIQRDLSAWLE